MPDTTSDRMLGGRLTLVQPARGHRFGHDAVLLAAACPAGTGHVADLGAGVGAAGLALAARVQGLGVTLVEIDPALAALAAGNAQANGFGERVRVVTCDVEAPGHVIAAAGLAPGAADHVIMNPPFTDMERHRPSPDPGRARAHGADAGLLTRWVRAAARLIAARGTLTLITRADALPEALAALDGRFGAIEAIPVHPRPEGDAIRVLVRATEGSRAPFRLRRALVLADAEGRPSAEAEAILREGAAI